MPLKGSSDFDSMEPGPLGLLNLLSLTQLSVLGVQCSFLGFPQTAFAVGVLANLVQCSLDLCDSAGRPHRASPSATERRRRRRLEDPRRSSARDFLSQEVLSLRYSALITMLETRYHARDSIS